jgi:hypothetical protein
MLPVVPVPNSTFLDNLMLQVVPPRLWFPLMQIVWGVLTFWFVLLFENAINTALTNWMI